MQQVPAVRYLPVRDEGALMPSSPNRRRVELPDDLYGRVEERARRDGSTVAAALAAIVTDGLTIDRWYGEIAGELHEIRRLVATRE